MTYYIPYPKQYKYLELEKLNKTEYEKVTSVIIDDYNSFFDIMEKEILLKFKNIKEIIFIIHNFDDTFSNIINDFLQNDSFNSKIALLNKLSNMEIEFDFSRFSFTDTSKNTSNLYYIYKNHMFFINWNFKQEIQENITYLNIMNVDDQQINFINNLHNNIEYLHLSCANYKCLKNITNLPITLKTLSITVLTNDNLLNIDFSYLKMPFDCKLEYDYIIF